MPSGLRLLPESVAGLLMWLGACAVMLPQGVQEAGNARTRCCCAEFCLDFVKYAEACLEGCC